VTTGTGNFFSPSSSFGTSILNIYNYFDAFKILEYVSAASALLTVLGISTCIILLVIDIVVYHNMRGVWAKLGYILCAPVAIYLFLQRRRNEVAELQMYNQKNPINDTQGNGRTQIVIHNDQSSVPTAPNDQIVSYPSLIK
jgi:hypothetical protein